MRRLCLVAFLVCLGSTNAFADTVTGGWTVSAMPDSNGVCSMARSYNDADDDNKKNSVEFDLAKSKTGMRITMILAYEGWSFDKDEAIVGDLIVDGKTIHENWRWSGNHTVLTTVFDDADSLVPVLGAGSKIVLRFGKDGEANFLIPNAGVALGAVKACLSAGDAGLAHVQNSAAPCQEPNGNENLALANASLVDDDKSTSDDIHKRPTSTFKIGDPFIIFIQPTGFACKKENGSYRASFNVNLKLIYQNQVAVSQKGIIKRDFTSNESIKYVNLNLTDRISGLIPGKFVIKLEIDDLVSGKSTDTVIPLTIVN